MAKKATYHYPPGTIKYTGKKSDIPVRVNYVEYDENNYKVESLGKKGRIYLSNTEIVQWYDIRGLHNEELIREISEIFGMHPLAIEDAVDVYKRPEHSEYLAGHFFSLKSLSYDTNTEEVVHQAVSMYFGDGFVITFQEHEDDLFEPLRERLEFSKGRIRSREADYLAYAVIDIIVDQYYSVIDQLEENIEKLEEEINIDVDTIEKSRIFNLKKQLIKTRKSILPLREAISSFYRSDSKLIDERTKPFIRDIYDHIIQVIDSVDSLRDIISGLHDLYLSEISLKMNNVMKFLTIITAIFVPITFLAGLYGMNFKYIPELEQHNGYFVLLLVMFVIVVGMVYMFRKKKWL